jgi:hypothetical protein
MIPGLPPLQQYPASLMKPCYWVSGMQVIHGYEHPLLQLVRSVSRVWQVLFIVAAFWTAFLATASVIIV